MTAYLYGRLQGRGREFTASAPRDGVIRTRAETRDAAIEVTLTAEGEVSVMIGRKGHSKATLLNDKQVVLSGNIETLIGAPA